MTMKSRRVVELQWWCKTIGDWAKRKGWHDRPVPFPEFIALCHSELSEALEEDRNNAGDFYTKDGKPEGRAVEVVDCLIRILHHAEKEGWDLDKLLTIKMKYNENRDYRHKGKAY